MTSKRNLERRVDSLEDDRDLPEAGLITVFSASTVEPVDRGDRLARIDGELHRLHEPIYTGIFP